MPISSRGKLLNRGKTEVGKQKSEDFSLGSRSMLRKLNSNKFLSRRGFTLFELLIAISVVGLMVGIVVTQVDDWFDKNIKETSNKLSSTIRYLHDKASSQNLYIRLVFDFEKNSYWVEATSEQFLLTSKEVQEAEAEEAAAEAEEEEDEKEEVITEGEDGEEKTVTTVKKYRTPTFTAVEEFLLKSVKLPDGVYLKDVYTSHDKGPVSIGQAFIYFFPNGYIEPAIINLRDEDDELNYSIKINPLMGTTSIESEYRELE